MIKKRIIFTFYYCEGYFVQSRNFSLQKVGDIEWIKRNFDLEKISNFIDEVAIINLSKKDFYKDFLKSLRELSKFFLIPIIAGGKVNNFVVVEKYFLSGCDKILLNNNLHKKPQLAKKISTFYGAQSIVASIDLKKDDGKYYVYLNNGKDKLNTNPKDYIKNILKMDIGEILLRSIDKDGSGTGLDYDLINLIPKNHNKNLILTGGCGNTKHIEEGLLNKNINAVCTGNLFNFINEELKNTRESLLEKKIDLPEWEYKEIRKLKNIFQK